MQKCTFINVWLGPKYTSDYIPEAYNVLETRHIKIITHQEWASIQSILSVHTSMDKYWAKILDNLIRKLCLSNHILVTKSYTHKLSGIKLINLDVILTSSAFQPSFSLPIVTVFKHFFLRKTVYISLKVKM